MITREEYECKLGRFVGNVTNHTLHEMFKVINEYQNGLEQHIKSLEAQLANTEQLTCDGCMYCNYEMIGDYKSKECNRFPDMNIDGTCDTFYCNFHSSKDTQ